ncbi:MAG: hypothetical protein LBH40_02490 [Alphaproteobacteria bacterium]|jgi:hypothetical protein|nr:hypothetical protein [Alphaproteobacteria bacterium]
MIKKIVIFNDFIRFSILNWFDSANELHNLFSYQINKATNLPIVSLKEAIDINKFMQLNNLSSLENLDKEHTWAYFCNNITTEAESYLVESLKDCLIVGYHSESLMIDIFLRNNIPFIDTFETSFRFMQDSYFGFRTNIKDGKEYLLSKSLNINTMFVYANYLKGYYKRKVGGWYTLEDNSCLLLGQTSRDTVLIKKDSTFVSLLEYKEEIREIAKKYKTLYYKMHPLEPLSAEIKEFLQSIPNAVEENRNFYELMAQDNIVEVFGLNSGGISEAKFFGKKGTYLFEKPHKYYYHGIEDSIDIDSYTFIILNSNSYIFKINFWAEFLSGVIPTFKVAESEEVSFDNYQSILSNFLNLSSAYELKAYTQREAKAQIDKINFLEWNCNNTINSINERINYYEYLFNKQNNKWKKIGLNILCAFIPSKKLRKTIRSKYLNNHQ